MNIIEPTRDFPAIFKSFCRTSQENIGNPIFGGQTPGFWRVLWGAVLENAQLMCFFRGYIISQLLLRMSNGYIMLYPNLWLYHVISCYIPTFFGVISYILYIHIDRQIYIYIISQLMVGVYHIFFPLSCPFSRRVSPIPRRWPV